MEKNINIKSYNYLIDNSEKGLRLDKFLLSKEDLAGVTRSKIKSLIDECHITVNEQKVKKAGYQVKTGDRISVTLPPVKKAIFEPENIDFELLYEDNQIAVINKPTGLVVHPAPGNWSGTLVNALLYKLSNLSGVGGELRPGIVHRLDKNTSGLMVVSKTDEAHNSLSLQFKQQLVSKIYLCIVIGEPSGYSGKIKTLYNRHPVDRKRYSSKVEKGKDAVTLWKKLATNKTFSLLQIKLKTGRTHQIRVHFSDLGYPVLMDDIYGGVKRVKNIHNRNLLDILAPLNRQALHAYKISFSHPESKKWISFTAKVPEDMQKVICNLGFNEVLNIKEAVRE